jgi:hypothetical protein
LLYWYKSTNTDVSQETLLRDVVGAEERISGEGEERRADEEYSRRQAEESRRQGARGGERSTAAQ